jgi:hypothetical protein
MSCSQLVCEDGARRISIFYRINLTSHDAVDLGEMSGNHDVVWADLGKTVLFSRDVKGITNIWKCDLKDWV